MTTTRIILVSFIVDTVKNVTGNSQLPFRTTMLYLLAGGWGGGGKNECKPHPYKAIICTLKGLLKVPLGPKFWYSLFLHFRT